VVAVLKDGKAVASLAAGEEGRLILDRTSFYAERGGQIGDRGTIQTSSAQVASTSLAQVVFEVRDTQYVGDAIAHHGILRGGEIGIGDAVHTSVSDHWRREIRRHH